MRIAVVGAGVIGLTSAVALKTRFPDIDLEVFGEQLSPDTTGDGSAGLWSPYLLGDTPSRDVARWAGTTHRWLEELWKAGLAPRTGVSLVSVYRLAKDAELDRPSWTGLVYGARKIGKDELEKLSEEHGVTTNYGSGWQFLTYTSEPIHLLPWLTEELTAAGGRIVRRKIRTFDELSDAGYDLIVNCSGLGARVLANDRSVGPIRGQVFRVKASWTMHAYMVDADDGNYVIPNIDSVVLGGTHQEDEFDCSVREDDSKFIRDGCARLVPGLKHAEPVTEWVGLRPGRPRVRLEPERLRSSAGRSFTVIHNYGHGGSGVTLCWGCALDVVEIVSNTLETKPKL